jgi:hypothetical protein
VHFVVFPWLAMEDVCLSAVFPVPCASWLCLFTIVLKCILLFSRPAWSPEYNYFTLISDLRMPLSAAVNDKKRCAAKPIALSCYPSFSYLLCVFRHFSYKF